MNRRKSFSLHLSDAGKDVAIELRIGGVEVVPASFTSGPERVEAYVNCVLQLVLDL